MEELTINEIKQIVNVLLSYNTIQLHFPIHISDETILLHNKLNYPLVNELNSLHFDPDNIEFKDLFIIKYDAFRARTYIIRKKMKPGPLKNKGEPCIDGVTRVYTNHEISSAVEWLKSQVVDNIICELIDKAFEDVTK